MNFVLIVFGSYRVNASFREKYSWDFPGGLVVETLLPMQGGTGCIREWRAKLPHATQCGQKK